ncbi:MAG: type 1 glutamine amidotransferase domain-containing protein [Nocardioidaceae bacterium]|nr:type 1 glutamine amidotransferase domain-containing protein [Nocardioidaceae bacterium]
MSTYLFLTSNQGVEKPELADPWAAVERAGGLPTHAAPEKGDVQSMVNDTDKDAVFQSSIALADVDAADYDVLVLPGGTVNADTLRADADAVAFVRAWVDAKKPVAAICHAPWVLVEAGVLPGKTLTSFPSVSTDVKNAGGSWVDEEVFVCPGNDWTLITSRNPDDIPAFNRELLKVGGDA